MPSKGDSTLHRKTWHQSNLCVKRKSLIFFFWRKSRFFFFGVSRLWGKKTEKCMIRDLRFFCDATYTKKKKLCDLPFFFI